MPLDFTAMQVALVTWVRAATGLPAEGVVLSDQNAASPALPFVAIRVGATLVPLGACDSVDTIYDAGRPAGEELELRVIGHRELSVGLQAFTKPTFGNSSALALLSEAQTALGLPSVRGALLAAGLAPFDSGRVLNLSALDLDDFRGRAALDLRFYVTSTVSEFTTFIETVAVTDIATGTEFTIH